MTNTNHRRNNAVCFTITDYFLTSEQVKPKNFHKYRHIWSPLYWRLRSCVLDLINSVTLPTEMLLLSATIHSGFNQSQTLSSIETRINTFLGRLVILFHIYTHSNLRTRYTSTFGSYVSDLYILRAFNCQTYFISWILLERTSVWLINRIHPDKMLLLCCCIWHVKEGNDFDLIYQ